MSDIEEKNLSEWQYFQREFCCCRRFLPRTEPAKTASEVEDEYWNGMAVGGIVTLSLTPFISLPVLACILRRPYYSYIQGLKVGFGIAMGSHLGLACLVALPLTLIHDGAFLWKGVNLVCWAAVYALIGYFIARSGYRRKQALVHRMQKPRQSNTVWFEDEDWLDVVCPKFGNYVELSDPVEELQAADRTAHVEVKLETPDWLNKIPKAPKRPIAEYENGRRKGSAMAAENAVIVAEGAVIVGDEVSPEVLVEEVQLEGHLGGEDASAQSKQVSEEPVDEALHSEDDHGDDGWEPVEEPVAEEADA